VRSKYLTIKLNQQHDIAPKIN